MTQAFSDMLYLFSCEAHGIKPENKLKSSLDEIYYKAARQGVLPQVLVAIKNLGLDDEPIIANIPLSHYLGNLRVKAVSNLLSNSIVCNAINQLKKDGISCCVLKGATIAGLYHDKDIRISTDTDVYIDAENKKVLKKAIKVFEEHGYIFSGIPPNSNHYIAHHKVAGMMELHFNLYHELFTDVWFDNKTALTEPFRMVKTHMDLEIPALGVTDGYIYMCLHIIKHFLAEGVGIRPIMDFLLYTKHYKEEIDYRRFSETMDHLKYNKFIDIMMSTGVKYLGFLNEDFFPFDFDEEKVQEVLTDIEGGGLFGHDEEWREGFRMIYNEQRFKRFKGDDYKDFMKSWEFKRKFRSGYVMRQRYPYVVRYGFLLPIAWAHRIINYTIRLIFKKPKSNNNYDELVQERLNLIQELDMI